MLAFKLALASMGAHCGQEMGGNRGQELWASGVGNRGRYSYV